MTTKTNVPKGSAKAAHVNMMEDTIIANLPDEALRSILRGLLGVDSKVTPAFRTITTEYLEKTKPTSIPFMFDSGTKSATPSFYEFQKRYRCLMGCGQGFQTLEALKEVLSQACEMFVTGIEEELLLKTFAVIDTDVVQATTAVQKQILTSTGLRSLSENETKISQTLINTLAACQNMALSLNHESPFERAKQRVEMLFRSSGHETDMETDTVKSKSTSGPVGFKTKSTSLETTNLGKNIVPRVFMGLWQFSSPAWGSASHSKITTDFRKHVDAGFVAYDMADHYGDAEVTFGQFRSSQPDSNEIYCATKWCVFEPTAISQEVVDAAITERLRNLNSETVELLQFHWQDYSDPAYIQASKMIMQDSRVIDLGLCNFDTEHMQILLDEGIQVASNQVQFSLIDLRPTFKMATCCRKHNVKLLTYGSLCGGLLADKWLNKPAPNLFSPDMTPSSRKYFEMIMAWGSWPLFQELLSTLSTIASKHSVSISTVAVRWVLEHDYVGAVIIGARMGVSEHTEENLKVFEFKLDAEDQAAIQKVLDRSRAREVMEVMGDCGAEYRQ